MQTVDPDQMLHNTLSDHGLHCFTLRQQCLDKSVGTIMALLKRKSAPFMDSIVVSLEGVIKLIKGLNSSKALGPDGFHPRVLKELANELDPVFNSLLIRVKSQRNGFLQTFVLSLRKGIWLLIVLIAPCP